MADLDAEEGEILDAYHAGELERLTLTGKELDGYRAAARAVSRKDQRVNIRISTRDLEDLKIKALERGMPYQTLIASVLHQYAAGRLSRR
ncbi:MAG: antitoxin [bacterium]|nr:antitoxin [bacterium]